MPPSIREYLQHILDEIAYLRTEVQGVNQEKFEADETLKRAFVSSIENIRKSW